MTYHLDRRGSLSSNLALLTLDILFIHILYLCSLYEPYSTPPLGVVRYLNFREIYLQIYLSHRAEQ